ncbi:MAG: hypothetical protein B6D64_04320 [Bacteroidetes bacterium 4484_276]|nr:MAG: hypothetical protein B6D64_04320 [Bacteroidetes bacterium 4484_276]
MNISSKIFTIVIGVVAILVLISLLVYFLMFSKNAQYKKAIAQADNNYSGQNYSGAKTSYEEALIIKPEELYPLQKLEEIDNLLKQKEKQQKYSDAIQTADNFFNQKDYEKAREFYLLAINFNPDDIYPVDQIKKMEDFRANLNNLETKATITSKKDYHFHIVIGSFENGENARAMLKKWKAEGQDPFIIPREEINMEAVAYDSYPDIHTAHNHLKKIREDINRDAWVLYYMGK